jgi:hypothetical protein
MGNMIQIPQDIAAKIILSGDIKPLNTEQRAQYLMYRAEQLGLDPLCRPFDLIESGGKVALYANKEAAAQLNRKHSLSAKCVKEEVLFNNTVFKVTYGVSGPPDRYTEDCAAVALTFIDKEGQKPLAAAGIADAIKKCHTAAKRRAILAHCGCGANDVKDEEPLIVVDQPPQKEEIKEAQAEVKDTPADIIKKAEEKHDKKKADGYAPEKKSSKELGTWRGKVDDVIPKELPSKKPCWTVKGADGLEFSTADVAFKDVLEGIESSKEYEIKYEVSGKGNRVIQEMRDAK